MEWISEGKKVSRWLLIFDRLIELGVKLNSLDINDKIVISTT